MLSSARFVSVLRRGLTATRSAPVPARTWNSFSVSHHPPSISSLSPVVGTSATLPALLNRGLSTLQSTERISSTVSRSRSSNFPSSSLNGNQLSFLGPIMGDSSVPFRSLSTFSGSFLSWLKIPKGFKNFYPGGESNNSSDKNKGKQKDNDPDEDEDDFPQRKNQKQKNENNGPDLPPGWQTVALGIVAAATFMLMGASVGSNEEEISFQEFKKKYLMTGNVDKITIIDKTKARVHVHSGATATPIFFNIGSVDSFERQMEDIQKELGVPPSEMIPIQYTSNESPVKDFLVGIVPHVLILGLWLFVMGRMMGGGMGGGKGVGGGGPGGIFKVGKANATMITKESNIKTTFKDVAGLEEAKVEIMEFVKFLQNPRKFKKIGAKLPKGALLVGPPGTGKTLIARATAGESGVPFFSMSGSDFIEMFVGVGPSRVRDLFKQARENSPCIVFIDEIDAVGRARGKGGFSGGNDERENTLNQLLVEMDGFVSDTGVVVLAGTNRADILDKALLRPGRFDRQILIDKPDIRGRKEIFEVHLKPLRLKDPVGKISQRLAALTPGFAGADIANICNEAALIAARHNKTRVEMVDFEAAVDRVIGGLEKKNKVMSPHEKALVAHHEAGHAVCGWFLEHADPLLKVTIVPRGAAALGYAQYLPQELNLYNTDQILDKVVMALGGRAAEEVFFGKISTGASDDLRKVTQMIYGLISIYGMNDKIGHLSFPPKEEMEFQKPYSEKTAELIDAEARRLVEETYARAVNLVREKKDLVKALAEKLLDIETINHDHIVDILGPRPFSSFTYDEFVKESAHANVVDADASEITSDAESDADVDVDGENSEEAQETTEEKGEDSNASSSKKN